MKRRTLLRLQDILDAIEHINQLLNGVSFEEMEANFITKAAFERFLEIASEASRHVPPELKAQYGSTIPWRNVADLGNHLRHAYDKSDATALWDIYQNDLGNLEAAIRSMIAEHPFDGPTPPASSPS